MAFYPDELSPIDKIRHLGKLAESADGNPAKNRRQWKSLVLGKKEMGMNNFATITEEKEDEISSDGSHGGSSNKEGNDIPNVGGGPVANKKIIFPKPRKYITSRVSERKEDISLKNLETSLPPSPPYRDFILAADKKKLSSVEEFSNSSLSLKSNENQVNKLWKVKNQDRGIPRQEFIENYALCDVPIETQWREAVSGATNFAPRGKNSAEKINGIQCESIHTPKSKQEDKKNSKNQNSSEINKQETKTNKRKGSSPKKGLSFQKGYEEMNKAGKAGLATRLNKGKQKSEKSKTLNMKEVVNVYKNLAYGSKDEIKSFVENLSFVKDEPNVENDKNLLSVMNLKVLENKIKHFTKKNTSYQEPTTSRGGTPKPAKSPKKPRKAHIERLARHKVVKVPAVLKGGSRLAMASGEKSSEPKNKKQMTEDKEPWKYVGMESALDKTYFVYPAYPPSVNLRKTSKKPKTRVVEAGKNKGCSPKEKKGEEVTVAVTAAATTAKETKVKPSEILLRSNACVKSVRKEGTRSVNDLIYLRGAASKVANRPSATTVCRVEFRRTIDETPKAFSTEGLRAGDPSLLVYLHGTKAINVRSPYADKQFSRVKFFRKDGRGLPLIRGLDPKFVSESRQNLSVRNICLPKKSSKIRPLDLLDFDEDIQNITDFLRSQNRADSGRPEENQEREYSGQELRPSHRRPRQRRPAPNSGRSVRPLTFSPDSIIDEISKDIEHLQYLPDTEENRNMIAEFFEELDNRIEATRNDSQNRQNWSSFSDPFNSIPILGY